MSDSIVNAKKLIDAGRIEEAAAVLEGITEGGDVLMAERHYLMGRIAWKLGQKTDAINHYEAAVALDPASEAVVALEQAREIMDFFNKDLYNP